MSVKGGDPCRTAMGRDGKGSLKIKLEEMLKRKEKRAEEERMEGNR